MDYHLNKIKVVLAEKNKSNKWLSDQLGVSPTTVSKWVTNTCQPPIETFMRIAQLLNVNLDDLVRYVMNPFIANHYGLRKDLIILTRVTHFLTTML